MLQEPRSGLRVGELVRVRGRGWRITGLRPFADCELMHLAGIDAANRGSRQSLLYPFDRPITLSPESSHPRLCSRRSWMRGCRSRLAAARRYDALWAAAPAAIDLLPHQLEPALAVVRGDATRLLLADEVGLGKTIQAGLILAELLARDLLSHALIVTPVGLRDQWASELATRFAIPAAIVDALFLRHEVASLPSGVNPWIASPVCITSLDFVKRPEVLRALEWVIWDLLIVDEAHAATATSDRGVALRALASRARRVALLTATPHAGDPAGFAALCDLGRIDSSETVALFRRSRAAVGLSSPRRSHLLPVTPTADEARVHDLLREYTRLLSAQAGAQVGHDARLVLTVLNKRALSSVGSLARSLQRRLDLLGDQPSPAAQLSLPLHEDDELDEADLEPDGVLGVAGLEDVALERTWLQRLLDAAASTGGHESKLRALRRFLERVAEPVIVFTEYRDTLLQVADALQSTVSLALLHGGLSRPDRRASLEQFDCGSARVLLATDAAGEGLNLQRRCRIVVNLELPWNPMRLEQRVGRVDRLGQRRRVHAIHLFASGTAEASVLVRLVAKVHRVRAAVGHSGSLVGWHNEREISDAVLGDDVRLRDMPLAPLEQDAAADTPSAPLRKLDLAVEAEAERARLEVVRTLITPFGTMAAAERTVDADLLRRGPLMTFVRAHRFAARLDLRVGLGPTALLLLYRSHILAGSSELLEEHLSLVHVALDTIARIRGRAEAHGLFRRCFESAPGMSCESVADAARRLAREDVAARVRAVRSQLAGAVTRWQGRERAIAASLDRALAPQLIQPSLFDRRALREAQQRRQAAAEHHADIQARLAGLARFLDLQPASEPELVLVLAITA